MSERSEKGSRSPWPAAVRTAVIVGTLAAGVWFAGERLRARLEATGGGRHGGGATGVLQAIETRVGPHRPVTFATSLGATERKDAIGRDLKTYYARRAYPGAPPMIPHEVESEFFAGKDCNTCHERGGFVPRFNAYAPVTPHPEYENCRQCHVRGDQDDRPAGPWVPTAWRSPAPPKLGRAAIGGGPPPIPHPLHLRENCLACHAGPAAPPEIRTPHPERESCQQCHVPVGAAPAFVRTERP